MITLTRKQIIIMKNMTALVLFIVSAISILNGFKLFLTADLFNALYALPKFVLGVAGVLVGILLKYCIIIKK